MAETDLRGSLEFLGLSGKESSIYLFICTHPKATAGEITKSLNIARSKTYAGLDKLVELGLIKKSENGVARFCSSGCSALSKRYRDRVDEVGAAIEYIIRGMGGISSVH